MAEKLEIEEQTEESPKKSGKLKLILGTLALLLIVGQSAAIFLLASGDTKAKADGGGDHEEEKSEPEVEQVEVFIDKFRCTNSVAKPGADITVSFSLFATVAKGQGQAFEMAANKDHKGRVREAIEKVVRGSNLDDLGDSNLGTVKRKIKEEVNKALRKSYIIEVVMSEYHRTNH
ncbi:MAG: hypothetical protein O3A00_04515 [Planctomycetota bacterium]|nr:hypothetical protein [Planctomycetota bacterium]